MILAENQIKQEVRFFIKAFEIRLPGHGEKSLFYSCLHIVMTSFRVMGRSCFLLAIACAFILQPLNMTFVLVLLIAYGKELLFTLSNQNNSHYVTSIYCKLTVLAEYFAARHQTLPSSFFTHRVISRSLLTPFSVCIYLHLKIARVWTTLCSNISIEIPKFNCADV